MTLIITLLNIVFVPLLSPAFLGLIRKAKAIMQGRTGPSIFQPYRDLYKLFCKDEVISQDSSWIFLLAPYIVFGSTLALAAGLPILGILVPFAPTADMLVFVYVLAAGTFFLALAGFDTGGGFGGFGASREMMIASLAEGGLILSLVGVAFLSGTSNMALMPLGFADISGESLLALALCGAAFWISLLAENARYPVDNPATHLELTMVHEAMILEYAGKRLALMEWAATNKLLIFLVAFVTIFFPWGTTQTLSLFALAVSFLIVIGKASLAALAIAMIESGMAKFRIFRVPDLLLTSFVLSVIGILVITL